MFSRKVIGTFCILLPLNACGRQSAIDLVATRDSAGIRIVENAAPAWTTANAWRIAPTPELEFGSAEPFYGVGNVVQIESGRIFVAHRSTKEILIYSSKGKPLGRFGGPGGGPGEFGELSGMYSFANGDSLLTFDAREYRASVFDTLGNLARTYVPASMADGQLGFIQGTFADGSVLVVNTSVLTGDTRGLVRPAHSLSRLRSAGAGPVHLVDVPASERFFQDTPFGVVDQRQPFFGQSSTYVAWKSHLYWAATDTFQVRVHAEDGRLVRIVRKRQERVRVSAKDVEGLITRQVGSVEDPNTRRAARRILENVPVNEYAPAFGWPSWAPTYGPVLQIDADGNIWIVEYFMPGTSKNVRTVFDSAGRWLGSVDLPDRFAPKEIGSDYVLGTWQDSLDVEHIRRYRIIKPSR